MLHRVKAAAETALQRCESTDLLTSVTGESNEFGCAFSSLLWTEFSASFVQHDARVDWPPGGVRLVTVGV